MKRIVKQVAGIDVSQKELVVSLGRMYDDLSTEMYACKTFPNQSKGFMALLSWSNQLTEQSLATGYVMEATGVYHESLAYFLAEKEHEVSIVLPNKISNYFRTLEVKTITDKTSSEAIARFGLERKLDSWKKPGGIYKKLRQLTRERDQLIEHRTMTKNHLHAEQAEAEPNKSSVIRFKKQIEFFNKQEKEIKAELETLIKHDEQLRASVKLICSLSGIGTLTATTVLAETNGFELVRNKRQLVSYAGLDVREKQSGTSVKGKARISKKGNKYLRKAMHLPALAAIRHDERFKAIFARLVAKHGIKMKAVVAVQRKLLEMIFIIYKTNIAYDKEYLKKLESSITLLPKQAG
jgi:transposase